MSSVGGGGITISYTTLAEIAVAAAVIGGVAFIASNSSSSPSPVSAQSGSSSSSSKNKKKKRNTGTGTTTTTNRVVEQIEHVSNQLEQTVKDRVEETKQVVQQVKDKVVQQAPTASTNGGGGGGGGGKNNKKKSKKNKNETISTTTASEQPEQKKNSDDDMRDYELEPEQVKPRVMKLVGGDIGAAPHDDDDADSWEKTDGLDQDDQGEWESVVSKKPSRPSTPSLSLSQQQAQPGRSIPGLAQTKKQRENAAKKAKEDALKREKEEEQERRLKLHREQLQRARQQEALLQKRPKPTSANYFGKEVSQPVKPGINGNLHAGLDPTNDEEGLIWN